MIPDDVSAEERERLEFLEDRVGQYFSQLQHGVWHTTGPGGLRGILSSGGIEPNRGAFNYSWPQSPNSYGGKRGYVSLFDFRDVPEEKYTECYYKWTTFFYKHKPFTYALQIADHYLDERFISAKQVRASPAYGEFLIPHVEAWFDGSIPVSMISGVVVFSSVPPMSCAIDSADLQRFLT